MGSLYFIWDRGSYPEVQLRNSEAASDLELVIIGDSFSIPVYTYLSTIFAKVDVVDPRYSPQCTAAEYIDREQPDLVIALISPDVFEKEQYWDLGVSKLSEKKEQWDTEKIDVEYGDMVIEPKDTAYNYKILSLENKGLYTISFEDLQFENEEAEGVQLLLYNQSTQKTISSAIFDVEFCRKYNDFEWTFEVPDSNGEYALFLYSGIAGKTEGIGVTYQGVVLSKN